MARFGFVLVFASVGVLACAQGETSPGVARDNCKLRDCGAAIGGGDGATDEDTDVVPDEGLPPEDTRADSTAVDTGKPDTTSTDVGCSVPSGSTCSTFPQCGCSSSLACDVTSVDGKQTCVAAGTKTLNQKCTDFGQCAPGFSCVYDLCMPFCASTPDCTAAGSPGCRNVQYVDSATSTTKDIPGFKVCFQQCDPINPSKVCGASTTCLFSSPTQTTCAAAGTSTTAGSCASDAFTCAPGYICVGTGDCRRWCRVGFTGDCPTGKTCGKLTTAPTISGIEYGVCTY